MINYIREQQPGWNDLLSSIENYRSKFTTEKPAEDSNSHETSASRDLTSINDSSKLNEAHEAELPNRLASSKEFTQSDISNTSKEAKILNNSKSTCVLDHTKLPARLSFMDGYNQLNQSFSYLFNLASINRSYKESQQKIMDEYRDTLSILVNSYMGNVRSQINRDLWKKEELMKNVGYSLLQKKDESLKERVKMKIQSKNESTSTADLINRNIDTLNTKLSHCVGICLAIHR